MQNNGQNIGGLPWKTENNRLFVKKFFKFFENSSRKSVISQQPQL